MRVPPLLALSLFLLSSYSFASENFPQNIFLVGQDIKSINDYMGYLKKHSPYNPVLAPDGFMVYTAISDLRGLSVPVDQGAGVNYADKLKFQYPAKKIIQLGLYMRYMLKETANGGLDQNIKQLGEWIKHSGRDVYLRIGYEFDNPENDYDPKEYILAYRHIVDYFKSMKISNVHYVWHTIAWHDKDWEPYNPLKWYPGDHYVDWVGISFFDIGRDDERRDAARIAAQLHKPLMIAESSPFKQYSSDEKIHWIHALFDFVHQYKVHFLCYINVDWDILPEFNAMKWGDARMQEDQKVMNEWTKQLENYRLNSTSV